MAREVFIKKDLNESLKGKVKKLALVDDVDFFSKVSGLFLQETNLIIKNSCPKDLIDKLYYAGSFSRLQPSFLSDVDLVLVGDFLEKDLIGLNENLRKNLRNYSLKVSKNLESLVEDSDEKGLLSLWSIRPVFAAPELKDSLRPMILKKEEGLRRFIFKENTSRRSRYGQRSGRLNYHIKNSPGGLIDLYQLRFLSQDENCESLFLYKVRLLNQVYSGSDVLSFKAVSEYAQHFAGSAGEFLKIFYALTRKNFENFMACQPEPLETYEDILLNLCRLPLQKKEKALLTKAMEDVEGMISSPSYHIWTVNEHLKVTLAECQNFIAEYQDRYEISQEEKEALAWASLFHDIKKAEGESSHSEAGARFALEFGLDCGWPEEKSKLVSWLVKEHLSLVKLAFKSDPFDKDLIKKLSLRGCEGRRAILLFILTCSDIKATNPLSWNSWKRRILEGTLRNLLGTETKIKDELLKSCDIENGLLLDAMSVKELSFVPFEVLQKDFSKKIQEGFEYYQEEHKIWVRFFEMSDSVGLAHKLTASLNSVGCYIHHAFFKTAKDSGMVYNWFCIETGVSLKAFKKRFSLVYKAQDLVADNVDIDLSPFKKIKVNKLSESYAVVSFKGADKTGLLHKALQALYALNVSIVWGHAVTWGEEIEDVFGVEYGPETLWKDLGPKASVV